jgi:hypothetical protein
MCDNASVLPAMLTSVDDSMKGSAPRTGLFSPPESPKKKKRSQFLL